MQRRSFISLVSAAVAAPAFPALPAAAVTNPASGAARTSALIRSMFHPRAGYQFSTAEVAAKARVSEAEASRAIKGLLDEGYITGNGGTGRFANTARRKAPRPARRQDPQHRTAEPTAPTDPLMAHLQALASAYFEQKAALV